MAIDNAISNGKKNALDYFFHLIGEKKEKKGRYYEKLLLTLQSVSKIISIIMICEVMKRMREGENERREKDMFYIQFFKKEKWGTKSAFAALYGNYQDVMESLMNSDINPTGILKNSDKRNCLQFAIDNNMK